MRITGPFISLLTISLLGLACGKPESTFDDVSCWATEASATSSSDGEGPYSAFQATGAANATTWDAEAACSDNPLAWAPSTEDGTTTETLELLFAVPIRLNYVRIYENFGPGTVQLVTVSNTLDASIVPYTYAVPSEAQGPGQACSALQLDLKNAGGFTYTEDRYDHVAIQMNTSLVTGWNEIDAVELVGWHHPTQGALPESCSPWTAPVPEEEPAATEEPAA